MSPTTSQPSQATNESVESLDIVYLERIQTLKEALAKGPQLCRCQPQLR